MTKSLVLPPVMKTRIGRPSVNRFEKCPKRRPTEDATEDITDMQEIEDLFDNNKDRGDLEDVIPVVDPHEVIRFTRVLRCSKCGKQGHNSQSCRGGSTPYILSKQK